MRRVALAITSTVAGLVILLSFKTHTASLAAPPAAVSGATPGTGDSAKAGASTAGSSTSGSSAGSSASTQPKTVTGASVDTRWGPVQVRVTLTHGKLTAVTAVDYPTGNSRDQQINAYAIPALINEALTAGSAKIDHISGATYTSDGFIGSLQDALTKAGR